jgi:predicted TIM-barrel fold metal-dependent hydrolase
MIIDIHAHLWQGRYEENKREIVKACGDYGIDRVYISSLGSLYPGKNEIKELNEATRRFMREKPGLIGGFCYVNPNHDNAADVLRQGIEEDGMSGMKLWCATFCDDPKVYPLVEKCIDYRVPVLIHTFHKAVGQLEFETLGQNVANLAKRYPQARLIMAHLGANCYLAVKHIRNYPNVSADISGSIFRRDDLDYAVKQIGAGRILFGSDMPDINLVVSLGQVEEAELTPGEKELIYCKNALKLLDRTFDRGDSRNEKI